MGFVDDAKDAMETAGRKIKETAQDIGDKLGDKVDEVRADAEVKKAEAERDATHRKNNLNEKLRGDDK